MDAADEVKDAARRRADALASGDAAALGELLHPDFRWTSHRGERFDRAAYIAANTGNGLRWHAQHLTGVQVVVDGDTAVLTCDVEDEVTTDAGRTAFRMPLTQIWVRTTDGWRCLAGHAGPRL